MDSHHRFQIQINESDVNDILERIQKFGFNIENDVFQDSQGRIVKIVSTDSGQRVEICIPVSDVVDEQEQLEYVLAMLGLDEDKVHAI